jgi:hypothetical protein
VAEESDGTARGAAEPKMFSSLPVEVREEGWESWEKKRMEREDQDAQISPLAEMKELPQKISTEEDTSDSDMSCLVVDDSPRSRRLNLDNAQRGMTLDQMDHLRGVKRKAEKTLHIMRKRKGGEKNRHLTDLIDDVSSVLTWQIPRTREADGKFRRSNVH